MSLIVGINNQGTENSVWGFSLCRSGHECVPSFAWCAALTTQAYQEHQIPVAVWISYASFVGVNFLRYCLSRTRTAGGFFPLQFLSLVKNKIKIKAAKQFVLIWLLLYNSLIQWKQAQPWSCPLPCPTTGSHKVSKKIIKSKEEPSDGLLRAWVGLPEVQASVSSGSKGGVACGQGGWHLATPAWAGQHWQELQPGKDSWLGSSSSLWSDSPCKLHCLQVLQSLASHRSENTCSFQSWLVGSQSCCPCYNGRGRRTKGLAWCCFLESSSTLWRAWRDYHDGYLEKKT